MNQLNLLACISRVVLTGDERAFEQIVREYQEPLRRFFMVQANGDELLADDLSQETFIRMWQRLGSFRQLSSFQTWFYRIAFHVWLDYLRQNGVQTICLSIEGAQNDIDDTEEVMLINELCESAGQLRQQWVAQSLMQMKEPAKTCLTLFYIQGLPIRKIADVLGLSTDSVKKHLCRGRYRLREILQQNNPFK